MKKYIFVGYFGKVVEEQHLMDLKDCDDVVLLSNNLDVSNVLRKRMMPIFKWCHQWKFIESGI